MGLLPLAIALPSLGLKKKWNQVWLIAQIPHLEELHMYEQRHQKQHVFGRPEVYYAEVFLELKLALLEKEMEEVKVNMSFPFLLVGVLIHRFPLGDSYFGLKRFDNIEEWFAVDPDL